MTTADVTTMEQIQKYIEKNLTKEIVVLELCRKFNINRAKLQTLFKTYQHDTVKEYIIKQRMYYVADKLINTNDSIREIATHLGGNRVNLYKQFKRIFHCTPDQYRQDKQPKYTPSFVPRTPPVKSTKENTAKISR